MIARSYGCINLIITRIYLIESIKEKHIQAEDKRVTLIFLRKLFGKLLFHWIVNFKQTPRLKPLSRHDDI